jgi:DNA-nicking Smr family endonuclease
VTRRRETSREEREQFEKAFVESRPLRRPEKSAAAKAAPGDPIAGSGLDGRTDERLRRGLLEPEASLDLHGLTESAAHNTLLAFLKSSHARGLKLVLVVTGKGAPKQAADAPFDLGYGSGPRGVLKSAVPRWLREPQFASLIAGSRWSHRRHGGDGALYVYLRKRRR